MRQKKSDITSRPTYAIIVDGECEVWYFQMLKRNEKDLAINVEPLIPQRKSLTDQFEMAVKLAKVYTKVFWIIDFDVINREARATPKGEKSALVRFHEFSHRTKKETTNIEVIVNNPCLEFWLLQHFEQTGKYYDDCGGAERQLRKHLADYEKTRKYYTKEGNDIFLRLKSKLKQAIKNSKKLGSFDIKAPRSPITEMHLLLNSIIPEN
ncbi:MAG TPA: RloB family protein [Cyclobacteriaceae bacterium]|nr:RloB family protein [Cyclobacteriaceae bacterium]